MSTLRLCLSTIGLASILAISCGGDSKGDDDDDHAGAGGENATGGAVTGGRPATGGVDASGGEDAAGGEEATGGADTGGGVSNTGGASTGGDDGVGGARTGGAAGQPSTGGALTAGGNGGAATGGESTGGLPTGGSTTGGALGAAGEGGTAEGGEGGVAGRLSMAGAGGVSNGGAMAGAAGMFGAAGSAGTTAMDDCSVLCGGDCGAQQPPCFATTFGLVPGGTADACVAAGSQAGASWCQNETCGGEAGCALTMQIGELAWTLDSSGSPTTLSLSATITAIEGTISAVAGQIDCPLVVNVPSQDPVSVTASGTLEPDGQALVPVFSDATADVSQVTVTSTNPAQVCTTVAVVVTNSYPTTFPPALLRALQARASALTCLDCRSDCPEGVACIAQ